MRDMNNTAAMIYVKSMMLSMHDMQCTDAKFSVLKVCKVLTPVIHELLKIIL